MNLINSKTFASMVLMCSGCVVLLGLTSENAQGQQPIRHELIRGDMPPGMAADYYRMSNRSLVGHVQPVQVMVPDGCVISVGGGGGFFNETTKSVSLGMMIGPVYRFKVSNLPMVEHRDKELYPSIEVINRLHPPQGLENDFPIQVVISRDDLQQAADGLLVTKVIYLEDPRGTLPHKHREGQQPSFDVSGGEDPLRAAEQLGRPMAILRMGSRVPMPNDPVERFDFGSPVPQVLPAPQPEGVAFEDENQPMDRLSRNPIADLRRSESQPVQVKLFDSAPVQGAQGSSTNTDDTATQTQRESIEQVEVDAMPVPLPSPTTDAQPLTPRRPDEIKLF